jgi:hypothetical protein
MEGGKMNEAEEGHIAFAHGNIACGNCGNYFAIGAEYDITPRYCGTCSQIILTRLFTKLSSFKVDIETAKYGLDQAMKELNQICKS